MCGRKVNVCIAFIAFGISILGDNFVALKSFVCGSVFEV